MSTKNPNVLELLGKLKKMIARKMQFYDFGFQPARTDHDLALLEMTKLVCPFEFIFAKLHLCSFKQETVFWMAKP